MKLISSTRMTRIRKRLQRLYGSDNIQLLEERFFRMIGRYGVGRDVVYDNPKRWDRSDVALITYADSIQRKGEAPSGLTPGESFSL